ncbi:MAG: helix-turn-helix domain-containing protein [Sciscionella sp.]
MQGSGPTIKKLDAHSLRALAHPLRVRIMAVLREEGTSTASRLAKRFDQDSGNMSWHLRQLAAHGFIAEDTARGTKRERWWYPAHEYIEVDPAGFLYDDGAREPMSVLLREYLELDFQRAAAFVAQDWSREWQESVEMGMWRLRLTPSQLKAVLAEVKPLLDGHQSDEHPGDGSEEVLIQIQAFPRHGGGGQAGE